MVLVIVDGRNGVVSMIPSEFALPTRELLGRDVEFESVVDDDDI